MVLNTFNALHRKMNAEQKRAVDAIEGPVMVVAGPGTGKTQILTLRIANILRKTDTPPDAILALTFTESGAFSMRKRLVEIMGSSGYRVHIHTFHGFCNDIIRRYPDAFPRIIGSSAVNDIDKIIMLKEIILDASLTKLRPFGDNFYYVNHIRQKISELKRENITPRDFTKQLAHEEKAFYALDDLYYDRGAHAGTMKGKYRAAEKQLCKNKELAIVYDAYQRMLEEQKRYDYEDMIIETIKTLRTDNDLLLELQEEYHYVLADEHQDANNAQNMLLELLVSFHDSPNLFIVGDEKQAIFRFQGASLDNFLYFTKRFPDALTITLRDNYRSAQHILDAAHSLIVRGGEGREETRPPLRARSGGESGTPRIDLRAFSNTDYEHAFLARDIKKKVEGGVPPHDIAVIYRNNRDADAVIRALEKAAVPFVVESPQSVLADRDVRKLLAILRAVNDFGNDGFLLPTLHLDFLAIDNLDIYKMVRYAEKNRIPLFATAKSHKTLQQAGVEHASRVHEWYRKLALWKKTAHNKSLLDFFEIVLHESGLLPHLLQHPEAHAKLEKISGLFKDIKTLVENHREYTLADFIAYLDLVEEYNVFIKKDEHKAAPSGVRLMTAHRSKGLEFEYVYIVGAYDTHWGNKRSIEHFRSVRADQESVDGRNDDERRLFYVALTRAKVGVAVSYAAEGESGGLQLPSQFIEEIDPNCIESHDLSAFEKSAAPDVFTAPTGGDKRCSLSDKQFLNELFLEQGLSVTALNNYLACPWRYFYSNLLRIPKSPNKHMLFGTAVHHTLKDAHDAVKRDGALSKEAFLRLFERRLAEQPFSENEFVETLKKGRAALDGYYDRSCADWGGEALTEYSIETILPLGIPEPASIVLRGTLDKMVQLDASGSVSVVDYKTGKPKSRNAIEGKTKSSDGSYKRQLVFYRLLLDCCNKSAMAGQRRFTMVSGEIDFVEPDQRGAYHTERFDITPEDTNELIHTIAQASKEIYDVSFWDARCDDSKCRYCALRDMMR